MIFFMLLQLINDSGLMIKPNFKAIGLMSGTSLDGIDVALIETDGHDYVRSIGFHYVPYQEEDRKIIRTCFGRRDRGTDDVRAAEKLLTHRHADAVRELLKNENISSHEIDYIGFHGQTIFHAPAERLTIQLGDGDLLSRETGIPVVYDFRSRDVLSGGEGAPLAPVYHRALAKSAGIRPPFVILNIGGVSNVTWIGADENDILAFDTGPGNALMDDYVQKHTGQRYDRDGELAASGIPDQGVLQQLALHPYFKRIPPKSLDRNEWDIAAFGGQSIVKDRNTADTLATLLHFTAESILRARDYMPLAPHVWYACGGGRHNKTLITLLSQGINIRSVDELGWNGDAIEAECFAYLAVRSILGLPISFPKTTGVKIPLSGGVLSFL
jgi:anhydro-N-acetylmuramic acid kinase